MLITIMYYCYNIYLLSSIIYKNVYNVIDMTIIHSLTASSYMHIEF